MGPGVQNFRKTGYEMVEDKKQVQSAEQADILSVLLRSESFADDNLVDQLATFLAAGKNSSSKAEQKSRENI